MSNTKISKCNQPEDTSCLECENFNSSWPECAENCSGELSLYCPECKEHYDDDGMGNSVCPTCGAELMIDPRKEGEG